MSLPIEDDALDPIEPALALPMLLPDAALLPIEPLAWLPLDRESLLALLLCALSGFDEPMLPEVLEPILPLPDTLGEPLPDWEPLLPFCVESLPKLLPVASFDF